jgi:hypothetical protein
MGDQRRKAVVVSDPDLMGANGVVLVDNRDDAKVEQPVEGPSGVGIVRTACDVVGRQQDLPHGEVVHPEREAVRRNESPLTNAGCRLLGSKVTWATGQTQRREAGRDGARGDQDDLSAEVPAGRDHVHERAEPGGIEFATG